MACRICGRGSCIESFHCIEEQERYDVLVERYSEKGKQYTLRQYERMEEETKQEGE